MRDALKQRAVLIEAAGNQLKMSVIDLLAASVNPKMRPYAEERAMNALEAWRLSRAVSEDPNGVD